MYKRKVHALQEDRGLIQRNELFTSTMEALDRTFQDAFQRVRTAIGEKAVGRTGGFARLRCEMDPKLGLRGWHQIYQRRIGTREGNNFETVEDFSLEKTHRLMKMYATDGHISSEQSRNLARWEYGGAFITSAQVPELGHGRLLLPSFSGLPDEVKADEALWMLVLQKMGWADRKDFVQVLRASKNVLAVDLLTAL